MKKAKKTILLVEDKETLRRYLADLFHDAGYSVQEAEDGPEAAAKLERGGADLVLSDLRLPTGSGMEVLGKAKSLNADRPVIIMTGYGSVSSAVEAMKKGAADYIEKPFEGAQILGLLRRVLGLALPPQDEKGSDILGESPALKEALKTASRAASSDATVLILGESGTGKELFARYVHARSRRASGPYVTVSCAAIPATLLENEMFGHEAGAYTGAVKAQAGRFERASGGTLFLDEVGDLPLELQPKLLRVLQEREIERVGGTRTIPVDIRLVAATHRDLARMVREGKFREDLYYRLNVVPLNLPPLRKRPGDVARLAKAFAEKAAPGNKSRKDPLSPSMIEALEAYPWPGNVRELQNVMERATILAGDEPLDPSLLNLPAASDVLPETDEGLKSAGASAARDREVSLIRGALKREGGNRSAAARSLGITYRTILNKIRKYGL